MTLSHRKTILRKIPNGLFIVTAWDGTKPASAVISFLSQTSKKPPLVTMAIKTGTKLYKGVRKAGKMAIHLLRKDQSEIAALHFKIRKRNGQSINGHEFILSTAGNPILSDIPMILEVDVHRIIEEGDHHIFICLVKNSIMNEDVDILTMDDTNWNYGG
jgi:flavin reductase (DIM6/NTAB) family NADH-FMN oxidoreductase RutF